MSSSNIGARLDGRVYCLDHAPEETDPILDDELSDYAQLCDVCMAVIPFTMSDEGIDGVRALISTLGPVMHLTPLMTAVVSDLLAVYGQKLAEIDG